MKERILNGCVAKDGQEIDGKEFSITTLYELADILKRNKEVHLTYFEGEDDLDLWVKTE